VTRLQAPALRMGNVSIPAGRVEFDIYGLVADINYVSAIDKKLGFAHALSL
jgi:hypothetical protein